MASPDTERLIEVLQEQTKVLEQIRRLLGQIQSGQVTQTAALQALRSELRERAGNQ